MKRVLSKYATIVFLLLGTFSGVFCQVDEDSIDLYISELPDRSKIDELSKAAISFQHTSLNKSLKYAEQRLSLANRLNDPEVAASTYNLYGNLYFESGLYTNAEHYYRIAYELYDSLGNKEGLATECHNLGFVYYSKHDTIESLNYYKESVFVRKSTGNNRRIGDGLTTLGEVYFNYGDNDLSLSSLYEAIEYYGDTIAYPRKLDCLALIVNNLLVVSPRNAMQWIKTLERESDLHGGRSFEQRVKVRYAEYYLVNKDVLRCIDYINQVNSDSIIIYELVDPLGIYRRLSEACYESGNMINGLKYSRIARELHHYQNIYHTADMTSEFKTRLNLRIADEELKTIRELNLLTLQRIKTEGYIKYFMLFAFLLLSIMGIYLLASVVSLKRDGVTLKKRKTDLEEAYNRSLKYKERILQTRESKNIFFKMISGKLDQPFRELSIELEKLSSLTQKRVNKERFIHKLEDIQSIGNSIEKSLRRVLLWSKLQRNKYEIQKTDINVNDYFHELLPDILGITLKKDIRVRFDIDPGLVIRFDNHSLKTILRVMVENSVDYSSAGSDIIIRGQKARTGSIISVTDFGEGIPGWLQNKIFNIDRDSGDKSSSRRLGIGLLIAKQMAEANDAYISFESNLKKGTTFFIHISN